MKKVYINPNTEIHEVELQQMIADSLGRGKGTKSASVADANEYEMIETSGSVWDEEE